MSLTDAQRARFARHLLLPELGENGQAQLVQSAVRSDANVDEGAWQVASSYLARAGVAVQERAAHVAHVPSPERVARLAGDPTLLEAARALAGALSAVETIKALTGIGSPSELPELFSLASEEA